MDDHNDGPYEVHLILEYCSSFIHSVTTHWVPTFVKPCVCEVLRREREERVLRRLHIANVYAQLLPKPFGERTRLRGQRRDSFFFFFQFFYNFLIKCLKIILHLQLL